VFTFFILTVAFDFYFSPLLVLIIAILNDGTILTISKDRVKPNPFPDKWRLPEIFLLSSIYGGYLMASTLVFYVIEVYTNFFQHSFGVAKLDPDSLRAALYLQVSITGQASVFIIRSVRDLSYTQLPGVLLFLAFIVAQVVATFLAVYGFRGYPGHDTGVKGCGWVFAIIIWVWCVIWYIPLDFIKKLFYAIYYRDWTVFKFQELNFVARYKEYKRKKAKQRELLASEQDQAAPENKSTTQITKDKEKEKESQDNDTIEQEKPAQEKESQDQENTTIENEKVAQKSKDKPHHHHHHHKHHNHKHKEKVVEDEKEVNVK